MDALEEAEIALQAVLDMCGFITWIESLNVRWHVALIESERSYLQSLRLRDREKRGVLVKLSSNYHEANLAHWARHLVPFHYPWAFEETNEGRFASCDPRYMQEMVKLHIDQGDQADARELPSYEELQQNLQSFDGFFQSAHAERRGFILSDFKPSYQYYIVDFLDWGARPLSNWTEIRVCAERFKGVKKVLARSTTVTFFRQSPKIADEPWTERVQPTEHKWDEDQFADKEYDQPMNEEALYMEDTILVRDMWKNKYAPRPGRYFSSFDGRRQAPASSAEIPEEHWPSQESYSDPLPERECGASRLSETASSENPTRKPLLLRRIDMSSRKTSVGGGHKEEYRGRPRSSRSRSPARSRGGTETRPRTPTSRSRSLFDRLGSESREIRGRSRPFPRTKSGRWNLEWLRHAIFHFKDHHTHLRFKVIAAKFPGMHDMTKVLDEALRLGMKFHLYIPESKKRLFASETISDLERLVRPRMYEPGYTERFLRRTDSIAARYDMWMVTVMELLQRPNAVAFIAEGGIVAEIARRMELRIMSLFKNGPSSQVADFSRGEKILDHSVEYPGGSEFVTTDSASASELLLIIGHLPGGDDDQDRTLFPSQATLESGSHHFRGVLGVGALKIIDKLMEQATTSPQWNTVSQWKKFLRSNNSGVYAPAHIPTEDDYKEAKEILAHSFPINWHGARLSDIHVPEDFNARLVSTD
ncbi:hypothetical protein C8R45DRAFT_850570 [Mycena sanguinolenta]|nr:hypothetical protein C8R45DRAFT_850570 [Mycena sanguinolenta]